MSSKISNNPVIETLKMGSLVIGSMAIIHAHFASKDDGNKKSK